LTRILWTTDPHLNHAPVHAWDRWVDRIVSQHPDALIVTGDISEGDDVAFQLQRMADALGVDIYFILGNHDFYHSSIAETRRGMIELCARHPALHYLTDLPPVELSPGVFLTGEDGWGDATRGNYERSPIRLNDFALIREFSDAKPNRWKSMLQQQGRLSAQRLQKKLEALPDTAIEVLIATHVPPFRESCWYMGKTTDDDWAPFFVCGQIGDTLVEHSTKNPQRNLTVLCGHTHHDGVAMLRKNLVVYTGAAEYGHPDIESCWLVDHDMIQREPPTK
tara:strand:- start:534611 stop:535444 length:834 start_codon:yes stop_codon:yes gene_type:complete